MLGLLPTPTITGLLRQVIRLRRRTLALLCAGLATAACQSPAVAEPAVHATPPGLGVLLPELLPAPPEAIASAATDRDWLVLDAVFEDLLRGTEDTPLHRRGEAPSVLRIRSAATATRLMVDSVRRCLDAEERADLPAADQARLDQAVEQLARRSDRSLGDGESAVPGVTREAPCLTTGREPVARVSLPGYSDDGRLALVRLTVPTGRHAAHLHRVLRLGDEGWQVILRESGVHL